MGADLHPTLLDNPVSPRKRQTLALGLLAGLVMGSCSLIRSPKRPRVQRRRAHPSAAWPLLKRLPCHGDERAVETWRAPIQLLADGLTGHTSVALIPVGSIEAVDLDAFSASLRQASVPNRPNQPRPTRHPRLQHQLLLTTPGAAKREQLRQLREQLALQGTPVAGWVLLDTSLEA